jgi:hypothetical protein
MVVMIMTGARSGETPDPGEGVELSPRWMGGGR